MKGRYFLSVGAILALVLTLLPARSASAADLCGQWDTIPVLGGEYTIQNNVWGATTPQCINVPNTGATAWSVTSSGHNQGSVAAYPSIYKGCHFGDCTVGSGMPILVNQVTTAPFSWNVTKISSGTWNVSAEAWFSPITDSSNGYNGGAEMMIWLDYMGMQPSGSQVGTASIAGSTWEVWYSNIGWNYIAYRRVGAASSISADLKSFINDAMSRGYIQPSWYLHDLEAGTELMRGGAGFASNSFTFAVNTGTPPPTTPPPTTPPPTTPPPTTPPPTTPPPSGTCVVGYTMNQWSNGFTADVKITNNTGSAINGWSLTWSFPSGQQLTGSWNATVTQTGANVTASNPASAWNGVIGPNGGTATFGFQASYSGANAVPANFALNGVACNGGTATPPPTTPPPTTPPPTTPPPTTPPPTTPPPTTPPPTTPPPTTPPPTTTVPGICTVSYVNQNDWGSGATINLTITNGSSSAIHGWMLTWTFPGNQQITNLWNASFTQSGRSVSVTDAGWNGTLAAGGGTANFGFNLSYSGSNAAPAAFSLNGVACH